MNKEPLSIEAFAYLFLATNANQYRIGIIQKEKPKELFCKIPANYKQIIENILCAENGWKEEFSNLMDIDYYFDNHFIWEHELSLAIEKFLETSKKKHTYDLEEDCIKISFNQKEIDTILSFYTEEDVKTMEHFTSLVKNHIYTREFEEEFTNYSARSVEYMKKLNKKIKW